MSELTVTVVRLSLLALLWIFVFAVAGVLRGDLFGTRVSTRRPPAPRPARPASVPATPAPVAPRGRAARRVPRTIVVTDGPLRGTTITLEQQPILIGRNPESTLVLTDDYASGRHARIFPQDGQWFVEDLGSTNGTFAGQQRVTGPLLLTQGSTLKIGTTVLELRK
jgi:hypothetical protein